MDGITQALGLKALAGFIGGVLSLKFFEGLTIGGRVWTVFGGLSTAYFCTLPVMEFVNFTPTPQNEGFTGFVLGLFSMSLVAAIFTAIKELKIADIIRGWLERRGG